MATKYLTAAVVLIASLSACATDPSWTPEQLSPKSVEVRFLSEAEWNKFQSSRIGCDSDDSSCYFQYETILGTTDFRDGKCVIYLPSSKGMPSYHVLTHELRHCYQGSHDEWH